MGVDYFHGVYATDLSVSGGLQTAHAIEDVLRSHGLVGDAVSRWCLDAEGIRLLTDGEASTTARNVGFSFSSRSADGYPIAACLLGDADQAPEAEYAWADFSIVSGPDYRIMSEGEYGPSVRVVEAPMAEGAELTGFFPERPATDGRAGRGWGHVAFGAYTFDASTGCTAPVCELDWFEPPRNPETGEVIDGPDGFSGLWRTALLIDTKPFGWTVDYTYGTYFRPVLPETDFKADLWDSLGGSAYEMGYSC